MLRGILGRCCAEGTARATLAARTLPSSPPRRIGVCPRVGLERWERSRTGPENPPTRIKDREARGNRRPRRLRVRGPEAPPLFGTRGGKRRRARASPVARGEPQGFSEPLPARYRKVWRPGCTPQDQQQPNGSSPSPVRRVQQISIGWGLGVGSCGALAWRAPGSGLKPPHRKKTNK